MVAHLQILIAVFMVFLVVNAQRRPGGSDRPGGRGRLSEGARQRGRGLQGILGLLDDFEWPGGLSRPGRPGQGRGRPGSTLLKMLGGLGAGDRYAWTTEVDNGISFYNETALVLSAINTIHMRAAIDESDVSGISRASVLYSFNDNPSDSVMAVRLAGPGTWSSPCFLFGIDSSRNFTDSVADLDARNGTTVSLSIFDTRAYDGTIDPLPWRERIATYMKNPALLAHCRFRSLVRPVPSSGVVPAGSTERVISSLFNLMAIYTPGSPDDAAPQLP